MIYRLPPLNALRVFEAAARHLSFKEAATELHITQAAVSHQVGRMLTVENVRYERLEVSSPGLDRMLKGERDFARFAGQKARVKMRVPVDGQRNFTGVVREAAAGRLQLEVDGRVLSLEISGVETARLVPEL